MVVVGEDRRRKRRMRQGRGSGAEGKGVSLHTLKNCNRMDRDAALVEGRPRRYGRVCGKV